VAESNDEDAVVGVVVGVDAVVVEDDPEALLFEAAVASAASVSVSPRMAITCSSSLN
jgi:hypothetical protein